jgi:hypothetical protein
MLLRRLVGLQATARSGCTTLWERGLRYANAGASDCVRAASDHAAAALTCALSALRGRVGERALQPPDLRRVHTVGPRYIEQRFAISEPLKDIEPAWPTKTSRSDRWARLGSA